jgi:hypothetical protein
LASEEPRATGRNVPPTAKLPGHVIGEYTAADRFKGGFRVLITGPQGFERTVIFAIDDDPAVIAERVRDTLEE